AWFLWRCIYLMKMPGLNRKVRIVTDWLLYLLFPPELAQTKIAFESGVRNQHFEPGDIIFQQGDLGDSVYVIEEGECEVFREQKGDQELLATLGRGAYFGEMALLSDRTRKRHDSRPHRDGYLDHSQSRFQQAAPKRAGFRRRFHRVGYATRRA